MYKSILAILLVGLLAAPALAQFNPSPAPPDGWGMDPTEWQSASGVCPGVMGIWNPIAGGWYICADQELGNLCQTIYIELWIELHATMTVYDMSWQFHLMGDAADEREFIIEGQTESNNPLWICLSPGVDLAGNPMSLTELVFDSDIFGLDHGEDNIPVDWQVQTSADEDNWYNIVPNEMGNICFMVPKCDQWWRLRGHFSIYYHQADGYYYLYYAICPVPYL